MPIPFAPAAGRAPGAAPAPSIETRLASLAGVVLRYGLVTIVLWYGIFKFTPAEAAAIRPLVENSPLLSWLYAVADTRGASWAIGAIEIAIAILVAVRPFSPRLGAIGSIGAIALFLTTLSFLATTPGMWGVVDGLLVPAGAGGFVIKDVALLGAALWSTADSLRAARHATGRSATKSR